MLALLVLLEILPVRKKLVSCGATRRDGIILSQQHGFSDAFCNVGTCPIITLVLSGQTPHAVQQPLSEGHPKLGFCCKFRFAYFPFFAELARMLQSISYSDGVIVIEISCVLKLGLTK